MELWGFLYIYIYLICIYNRPKIYEQLDVTGDITPRNGVHPTIIPGRVPPCNITELGPTFKKGIPSKHMDMIQLD